MVTNSEKGVAYVYYSYGLRLFCKVELAVIRLKVDLIRCRERIKVVLVDLDNFTIGLNLRYFLHLVSIPGS